jgi:DNA (cytosine-5)-methyltransferase 1
MQVLSLFTGAMGLDLGMERYGFQTTVAVENNPQARETIIANRPNVVIFNDVFDVDLNMLKNYNFDVITGGPPCQSWSYAGNRLGLEDHRGLCIPRFFDIVDEIKPRIAVMENVMGLLSAEVDGVKGAMYPYVIDRFSNSGYKVSCCQVDAADYGSPQHRRRVVFIASLDSVIQLHPTHSKIEEENIFGETSGLMPWMTLKDAIWDLKECPGIGASYGESQLKYLKMLKEGEDWRDLPEELQAEAMGGAIDSEGGRTSYFRRLKWNEPSPTLVCSPTQKSTCLCHPEQNRPLSIKEYARIQGFPDDWKFSGSVSSIYKQIGNAVPVKLAEAIGKTIINSTEKQKVN